MPEPVTVVFSANDNHAMLLGVALCSLFENKKGDYPIRIFVMDGGISMKNKARLRELEQRYHFAIEYVVPDAKLFEGISTEWRPIPAYYRVAIGRTLPADCHKALYMDCDIVVKGDIAELFHENLEGKTIAAVPDYYQEFWKEKLVGMCQELSVPMPQEFFYFNSGVMLIDLERWRTLDIESKLFAFIRANPDKLWVADQHPLNVVLIGDCTALPAKYNFDPAPTNLHRLREPFIIHFSGGTKPWYRLSALEFRDEYIRYADMTPWKHEKYRKFMDVPFAKKYHIYPLMWGIWSFYKKLRGKHPAA